MTTTCHVHSFTIGDEVLRDAMRMLEGLEPQLLTRDEVLAALVAAIVCHLVDHAYANDPLGPPT